MLLNGKNNLNLPLPQYLNRKFEVLEYNLYDVIKDGQFLNVLEDYKYKKEYDSHLICNEIENDEQKLSTFTDAKYPALEVSLTEPKISQRNYFLQDLKLSNIITFGNILIGIDDNKKFKIYANTDYLFKERDHKYHFITGNNTLDFEPLKISKVLIDSNQHSLIRHILVFDTNNNIYLLKMINNLDLKKFGVTLSLISNFTTTILKMDKTPSNVTLISENVIDFVYRDGRIYIGNKEGSLVILEEDCGMFFSEITHFQSVNAGARVKLLQIIDMQEVENNIYIVSKAWGLNVLNIVDKQNPKFIDYEFYHPFIKSIHVHSNPFYQHQFLGVLINYSEKTFEANEFFIELSLKDPLKPLIYRSYLSNLDLNFKYVTYDDKYTYLFEHVSNSMFVMSRSSTATSHNSVFKIPFTDIKGKEIDQILKFNDKLGISQVFGLMSKEKLYIMEHMELLKPSLNITFHQNGIYDLKVIGFSDHCGENEYKSIEKCQYDINYKFNVTNIKENFFGKSFFKPMHAIIIIIIVLTILSVIIYLNFDRIKALLTQTNSDDNNSNSNNNSQTYTKTTNKVFDEPQINRNPTKTSDSNRNIEISDKVRNARDF